MARGSLIREAWRVLAAIILLTFGLFAATVPWTPANFHGLIIGRAHREDIVRSFGNPDATSRTSDGEELSYKARGDHKGDLVVRLDRAGVVTEIQESLPIAIPRTKMYKEFGNDAQTSHLSWAKCAANALYRDPDGPLELTVYPARGFVLWPDRTGYDFAAIHYVARQPGLARRPPCVAAH